MHEANEGDPRADGRMVSLLNVLRAEPELRVFDGMMQIIPGGASRIEYHTLTDWLIRRATTVGIDQSLQDLQRYIEATELPLELAVALSGLTPGATCDMGRGILFVPWDSLQDSSQKRSVWERCVMGAPWFLPTGALVRTVAIEKLHLHQDDFPCYAEQHLAPIDQTELYDALMCMALVAPCAPHVVGSWVSIPQWAPVYGGGMLLPQLEGIASSQPFPPEAAHRARDLFEAFCALPANLKARLRLVMQRLNRAMRRRVTVDASIDLGIALEALYLSDTGDDRGELTFRLKTRAARFLGTTEAERQNIFRLVGDLYGMRSSAVHTGLVSATIRGRPANEVLADGFALTADTTRRFIASGEPDWNRVLFA